MVRNGGWCLTNLCHGKNPAVNFNKVASTLSVLSCLLYNLDSDLVIDGSILPHVLTLLQNPKESIKKEAYRILSDITADIQSRIQEKK
ncbi:unnamed protein product [Rotaria sordida]|uniref:Uncharacterized protein n=1 Tax=Rotaria sordida TaxID=392033 RepID=A0A815H9S9_9BILA|nr:unnamed protein product [Rotaria sordida]CAF4153245.1 unnamed protein product [Rotaria sordida]